MAKAEFNLLQNEYYQLSNIDLTNYHIDFWEIDETISELAYLTHDYFRYYGKFPSKIGKLIIDDLAKREIINTANDYIYDNYEGSGTSLVEAKLAGFDSIGSDINPFAVLASRVKTHCLDNDELMRIWENLKTDISVYISHFKDENSILQFVPQESILSEIGRIHRNIFLEFNDITKWFADETIRDLTIIKFLLLRMENSRYREFFALAFFAIIRRVSRAHDGEVRPHINKKKKQRDVFEAYLKKVSEMVLTMKEWNIATSNNVYSNSHIASNVDEYRVNAILSNMRQQSNKELGLVISHPPYLNCFDYIPVYKLKFLWAFGFNEIFGELDYNEIKKSEIKSYPVDGDKLLNEYFIKNKTAYKIIYNNLRNGGYCCVVIGDCTVKKQLFKVHQVFIRLMEDIGFNVEKIVYRSTHYGLGKYAYDFRADYHNDDEGKKDAIIFFRK